MNQIRPETKNATANKALIIAVLCGLYISVFDNGVVNAGSTPARTTDARGGKGKY